MPGLFLSALSGSAPILLHAGTEAVMGRAIRVVFQLYLERWVIHQLRGPCLGTLSPVDIDYTLAIDINLQSGAVIMYQEKIRNATGDTQHQ